MRKLGIQRYLLAGVLLFLPLWLTYLLLKFVFTALAAVSEPLVGGVLDWPDWALRTVSALLTLVLLYLLGWLGTRLLGWRVVRLLDRLVERVPIVQTIYRGARKLVDLVQDSEDSAGRPQRVVLIDQTGGTKAVGLMTQVLTDTTTGEEYAAVYLPTTPYLTSGFVQLVPIDRVHPSHMSMDEATSFIVSGGAVNPRRFAERAGGTAAR